MTTLAPEPVPIAVDVRCGVRDLPHPPSLFPFLPTVDSIRGFVYAASFAVARRCLRFLVGISLYSIVSFTLHLFFLFPLLLLHSATAKCQHHLWSCIMRLTNTRSSGFNTETYLLFLHLVEFFVMNMLDECSCFVPVTYAKQVLIFYDTQRHASWRTDFLVEFIVHLCWKSCSVYYTNCRTIVTKWSHSPQLTFHYHSLNTLYAWPGWSPPSTLARLQICRWRATDSLSEAIYVSEQVCIRWRSTGAYYTAKLTFSHDFPIKVWGAYCTSVRIIFEFLRYIPLFRQQTSIINSTAVIFVKPRPGNPLACSDWFHLFCVRTRLQIWCKLLTCTKAAGPSFLIYRKLHIAGWRQQDTAAATADIPVVHLVNKVIGSSGSEISTFTAPVGTRLCIAVSCSTWAKAYQIFTYVFDGWPLMWVNHPL